MAITVVDDVALREPRLMLPMRQPSGLVRVDWTNPLTSGLADIVVVSNGGFMYSPISNLKSTNNGTPPKLFASPAGVGLQTNTQSAVHDVVLPVPHLMGKTLPKAGDSLTLLVHGQIVSATPVASDSTSISSIRSILSITLDGGTNGIGIGEDTAEQIYGLGDWTAGRQVFSTSDFAFQPVVALLFFDIADSKWKLQIGNNTYENSSTTSLAAMSGTNPFWRTGYNASTSAPGNKAVYFGAFWGRLLSANERAAVIKDPYQLVMPA